MRYVLAVTWDPCSERGAVLLTSTVRGHAGVIRSHAVDAWTLSTTLETAVRDLAELLNLEALPVSDQLF